MSDLDLTAILARSEQVYGKVLDQFIDADGASESIRQHFNYDVPALIGAVQRLAAELEQTHQQLDDANAAVKRLVTALNSEED